MSSVSTEKETHFSAAFREFVEAEGPSPMHKLRVDAFDAFKQLGFPHPKLEDWKYTNSAAIAKVDWKVIGEGTSTVSQEEADKLSGFNYRRSGFTALNLAFGDVAFVRIPKDESVEEPIEFDFGGEDGVAIFPHIVIVAEPGSKATVIEKYGSTAPGLTNAAVQIFVGENANITHYRVQKDSADAFHISTTEVTIGRDGRYDSTSVNLGGALSRHEIDVRFTAEGGEAWIDGLYMLSGSQHSDTHSVIDHTVPNCTSHQNYKGVLNDKSRGVFNGKVFVRENAHGTDAQQSNKNLLLSNDARVDTKPQLEIFNDDVKCSHGATVGQLEDEELFYLLTRGLPETLARNLLTYGFAEEIISKIGIESIKSELDGMVLNRLNAKI
ncbi:MAG: Fe-S cluster assembly protein SufD [Acidobacteria bacterium]|nr:Fe-S cluster assembly protein SufD [Acidobacteriota bacterium]